MVRARRMSRPGRSAIRQPRGVTSTGMSTSSAAVRPMMSAPGPRPGSSARYGRSGTSVAMTRAASIGVSPGIDPIPVAVPGTHGNACFSATGPSLSAGPPRGLAVVLARRGKLPPVTSIHVPALSATRLMHGLEQGKRDDQEHAHGDPDGEEQAGDDRYYLEPPHRPSP